jgi:hypothetical protein
LKALAQEGATGAFWEEIYFVHNYGLFLCYLFGAVVVDASARLSPSHDSSLGDARSKKTILQSEKAIRQKDFMTAKGELKNLFVCAVCCCFVFFVFLRLLCTFIE